MRPTDLLPAAFARLAAHRGGEGVHHHGLRLSGSLAVEPRAGGTGAALLDRPGTYDVHARLSWGVGPFRGLPDLPGFGLRVFDADGRGGIQDLLLDGSRPAPHDRVLVVRRDLAGWYGTPLRLRAGGAKVQVAVRVAGHGVGLSSAGPLTGRLVVHDRGRVLATGRLALDPADHGTRFDLAADDGGLVSDGFWHRLRMRCYAASRHSDGSSTHRMM